METMIVKFAGEQPRKMPGLVIARHGDCTWVECSADVEPSQYLATDQAFVVYEKPAELEASEVEQEYPTCLPGGEAIVEEYFQRRGFWVLTPEGVRSVQALFDSRELYARHWNNPSVLVGVTSTTSVPKDVVITATVRSAPVHQMDLKEWLE